MSVALPDEGIRVELPSGDRVFYFDDHHGYYRCKENGERGRRLTAVTTVTKTLDHDPSRLLSWAARTQLIGVADLMQSYPRAEVNWTDPESIWETLRRLGLTFEDVRDRAGTRGTNIHREVFEALAAGQAALPVLMTPEEAGYAEGVIRFWEDEKPTPVLVEQIVYSERLGVAGRLDFYGSISSREGAGIIDLKTGGFLSVGAHAQVGGGYPLLMVESGWPAPEWAAMLQVKDGDYTLVEAEATPEDFELAVACYRAAGRINGAAGKARKAREA